jgi:hypothetical protein
MEIEGIKRGRTIRIILICSLFLFAGIMLVLILSRRYMRPTTESIKAIENGHGENEHHRN